MKYIVKFEVNYNGRWIQNDLTNNGAGFSMSDARFIASQLRERGHRNVIIETL